MTLLIIIIVLALIFDFINGFHDAANSIATIVSTRVLTPLQAVAWAAFFNFVAFAIVKFVFGGNFGIANTISKTVVEQFITPQIMLPILLSGVIAAITWNLITWWLGIPSSSSHTLIGGFIGAAITATLSINSINWYGQKGVLSIMSFIFLAPLIGMILSTLLSILILNICRKANPHKANRWFKHLQLASSALFSIGHGMNDSQKTMGIIAITLISFNADPNIASHLPAWMKLTSFELFKHTEEFDWIPLSCFIAIALGTLSGGWRIVKTMGTRITKVTSFEGVVAETAGAMTLYISEILSIPVSTTHTITGAIMGVGATKRLSAVRWGVTKSLLIAWILTIPVSALLASFIYFILRLIGI